MKPRTRLFFDPDAATIAGGASPSAPAAPAQAPVAPAAPATAPAAPAAPERAVPDVAKRARLSPSVLTKDQVPGTREQITAEAHDKHKSATVDAPERDSTGKFAASTPAAPTGPAPRVADAPSEPAAPLAPVQTTGPKKITIGGKEYTEQELEARLNPVPTPAAPATAAPPADSPSGPSESVLEEVKQLRNQWVVDRASTIDFEPLDEDQLNTILDGGDGAVAAFNDIRRRDAARAMLETRLSLEADLNPLLQHIHNAMAPVLERERQLAEYQITTQFSNKYAELIPHEQTARKVAEQLTTQYPEETSKMTPDQFVDEIARQTENILNARAGTFGVDNWRKLPVGQQAALPAPARPAAPSVAAPTSNRPTSASPTQGNFQAVAASRLRGR